MPSTASFAAISGSAPRCTYRWQTPAAWPITGMSLSSMIVARRTPTSRARRSPRRGRAGPAPRVDVLAPPSSTAARESIPAASSTPWMTAVSARLVSCASRPPLSSTALPLFQARPTICTSASGRDSNTTPSRPSGAGDPLQDQPVVELAPQRRAPEEVGHRGELVAARRTRRPASPASRPSRLTSGVAHSLRLGVARDLSALAANTSRARRPARAARRPARAATPDRPSGPSFASRRPGGLGRLGRGPHRRVGGRLPGRLGRRRNDRHLLCNSLPAAHQTAPITRLSRVISAS